MTNLATGFQKVGVCYRVCPQSTWDKSLALQVESFRSHATLEYMPSAAGNDPFGVTAGSFA